MDDASLEESLYALGFSAKEVDTYLSILELGGGKASTIAEASGVSKRYVYSIAERLADRGFVEVNDHVVPTMIRPYPPERVITELTDDLEAMQPALESRFSRSSPRSEQFEVIKSRVTVLKRISEGIERAEQEVTLSIPYRLLDEVGDELRAAFERDVLVLLLVTGVSPSTDLAFDGMASVARAWKQPMPTMLTIDQETGLVVPDKMLSGSNSPAQAIVFEQEQLSPVIAGSFLGNYFPMATEVYTTDPIDLPATYQNFRHAVLQTRLHRCDDRPIRVRITGYTVSDGNAQTEFEGAVVDVRQSLLEPPTSSFPVENTLIVESEDRTYSVGGTGAFVEDIEATTVELRPADRPQTSEHADLRQVDEHRE
ncbi:TrmB family transcriptional regulator [Halocatena salina]|uniref:TrmB family transcriptional regulator n=1 Tax=Halocatena salina TaxID=2934340 RepID=A0A8U0A7D2_9EURY|nr:TrmB family transcriptional regulator sugar-binding domain-containing protein [Halocatena salina]UPM44428.1 TrmB family transcriptional regulator [Halocatena salina]